MDYVPHKDKLPAGTKTVSPKPLNKGEINLIKMGIDFFAFRAHNLNHVGLDKADWLNLTPRDFAIFRLDPDYRVWRDQDKATAPPLPAALITAKASASTYTPADLFKRGIKRDPSLFPILKDERFNDSWHRSFKTQARAQDLMNVLDPKYKPQNQEDKLLFDKQQAFMYAVLEATVKTDRGKAIVHDYEDTYDAQAVYKELSEHHLTSTKAQMDSSTILSYITSV